MAVPEQACFTSEEERVPHVVAARIIPIEERRNMKRRLRFELDVIIACILFNYVIKQLMICMVREERKVFNISIFIASRFILLYI